MYFPRRYWIMLIFAIITLLGIAIFKIIYTADSLKSADGINPKSQIYSLEDFEEYYFQTSTFDQEEFTSMFNSLCPEISECNGWIIYFYLTRSMRGATPHSQIPRINEISTGITNRLEESFYKNNAYILMKDLNPLLQAFWILNNLGYTHKIERTKDWFYSLTYINSSDFCSKYDPRLISRDWHVFKSINKYSFGIYCNLALLDAVRFSYLLANSTKDSTDNISFSEGRIKKNICRNLTMAVENDMFDLLSFYGSRIYHYTSFCNQSFNSKQIGIINSILDTPTQDSRKQYYIRSLKCNFRKEC